MGVAAIVNLHSGKAAQASWRARSVPDCGLARKSTENVRQTAHFSCLDVVCETWWVIVIKDHKLKRY